MTENDGISLKELIQTVAEERGLDLRGYKSSTLDRRVRKRMFQLGAASFQEYLEKVREDPNEINELLNTVLINVTEFFRDPQAWDYLRSQILPPILGQMKPGDSFRAWSAGCASGEEPYSLAILIADYFGSRIHEFDIKIYATDIDEDALNTARRGEYGADRLRRVSQNWKQRYFSGHSVLRIGREIRRMLIFGRNNLQFDAPISHCDLVTCRNVLIYFDTAAQRHVLARLNYALDPGGILFLGKAESKLSESKTFKLLNSRWRIFQKETMEPSRAKSEQGAERLMREGDEENNRQELERLEVQLRYLLDAIRGGVVLLDSRDIVTICNDQALAVWGLTGVSVQGRRFQNTELAYRCPEMAAQLESSRGASRDTISFDCRLKIEGEERLVAVVIRRALAEGSGERIGTIIYSEDVTPNVRLQNTVEQLEATSEELQSANEELETTNEELQSTNEELETTNEELQSTNEELETTNEELQSLNEELENMNDELEARTLELNNLTARYAETLKQLPWPVMLVDREERIQLWNASAQKLFGVGMTSVVGVALDQLPVEAELRKVLIRRCRAVLERGEPSTLRSQRIGKGAFNVQFTPISRDETIVDGVMVMFGPLQPGLAKPPRESISKPAPKKDAASRARKTAKKAANKLGRKNGQKRGR
jgi:two-component system, chemotaxis family, CheB/CheR fusion protein